jgi:hypothetical protein
MGWVSDSILPFSLVLWVVSPLSSSLEGRELPPFAFLQEELNHV